jgi:hypothetical protein
MSEVTEKTVTVKVKNHPRDMYYEGRQTREHLSGIMQYMSAGGKMVDVERVQSFLKTIKESDIVGVEHTTYKIESVDHATLTVEAITQNNERHHLGTEDISFALGIGYCEILYRDGKPYGIETEKQVKVKIVNHLKAKEANTSET